MKLPLALLFAASLCAAEPPKTPPVVFSSPHPACSLIDGKLVLIKPWPIGSWEDCAYAALGLAVQLDGQKVDLIKQVDALKSDLAKAQADKAPQKK